MRPKTQQPFARLLVPYRATAEGVGVGVGGVSRGVKASSPGPAARPGARSGAGSGAGARAGARAGAGRGGHIVGAGQALGRHGGGFQKAQPGDILHHGAIHGIPVGNL